MQYIYHYPSPLGGITLCSNGNALIGLWFDGSKYFGSTITDKTEEKNLPVFNETKRWLDIYFSGAEPDFTPPLSLCGSEFRIAVWELLLTVPYGGTAAYGEIAARLARSRGLLRISAQAVGGAVGHNPISIIIPCHRIMGADGSLTGYAGGIDKKLALLKLERSSVTDKANTPYNNIV